MTCSFSFSRNPINILAYHELYHPNKCICTVPPTEMQTYFLFVRSLNLYSLYIMYWMSYALFLLANFGMFCQSFGMFCHFYITNPFSRSESNPYTDNIDSTVSLMPTLPDTERICRSPVRGCQISRIKTTLLHCTLKSYPQIPNETNFDFSTLCRFLMHFCISDFQNTRTLTETKQKGFL